MAKWQCNSCGATYDDGARIGIPYYHACGPIPNPDYQPHWDADKFDSRQEIERPDKRDENLLPGVQWIDNKPVVRESDPHDATRIITTTPASLIRSEGKGRTLVAE